MRNIACNTAASLGGEKKMNLLWSDSPSDEFGGPLITAALVRAYVSLHSEDKCQCLRV